jgi:hypothetical protein
MEQSPGSVGFPTNSDSEVSFAAPNGSMVSEATADLPDFRNSYLPLSRIISVGDHGQLMATADHKTPGRPSKFEICTDRLSGNRGVHPWKS